MKGKQTRVQMKSTFLTFYIDDQIEKISNHSVYFLTTVADKTKTLFVF
jgi:hypothetical protein